MTQPFGNTIDDPHMIRPRAARTAAARQRAETLADIEADPSHLHNVVLSMCESREFRYLTSLTLLEVLRASGVSPSRSRRLVRKLCRILGEPEGAVETLTLGWLRDGRSRGRRLQIWNELHATLADIPTTFPFSHHPHHELPTSPLSHEPLAEGRWMANAVGPRTAAGMSRSQALTLLRESEVCDLAVAGAQWSETEWAPAASRRDPYYRFGLLRGSSTSVRPHPPLPSRDRRRPTAEGELGTPQDRRMLLSSLELVQRVLGVVHSFRAVTEEQLLALVGPSTEPRALREVLQAAWSAGVLALSAEDCIYLGPRIIAPGQNGAEFIASFCTPAAELAILGKTPWTGDARHHHHSILAAELLLRIGELCDAVALIGEQHCALGNLTRRSPSPLDARWAKKRADGVVVRSDGLPIAIEMTRNTNRNVIDKVDAWVDYIERVQPSAGGATVLFVAAPDPYHGHRQRSHDMTKRLQRIIAGKARALSPSNAARLCVVSWADWFPTADQCRWEAFEGLRALCPDGEGRWNVVELLEQTYSWPSDNAAAYDIVANASMLGQTPPAIARRGFERTAVPNDTARGSDPLNRPWRSVPVVLAGRTDRPTLGEKAVVQRNVTVPGAAGIACGAGLCGGPAPHRKPSPADIRPGPPDAPNVQARITPVARSMVVPPRTGAPATSPIPVVARRRPPAG